MNLLTVSVSVFFGRLKSEVTSSETNLLVVRSPTCLLSTNIENVDVVVKDEADNTIHGELRYTYSRVD